MNCPFCQSTCTFGNNRYYCDSCRTITLVKQDAIQQVHIKLWHTDSQYESVCLDYQFRETKIFLKEGEDSKVKPPITMQGILEMTPQNAIQMADRILNLKAFL